MVKDLDFFIAKRKVCAEVLEIMELSNPYRVLGVQDQCESGGFEPQQIYLFINETPKLLGGVFKKANSILITCRRSSGFPEYDRDNAVKEV